MKLVLSIVRDDDADKVINALVEQGFSITRMASTGGFLREGNTTIMSGVEEDRVDEMLEIIRANVTPRSRAPSGEFVSGATAFVLNLESIEKV